MKYTNQYRYKDGKYSHKPNWVARLLIAFFIIILIAYFFRAKAASSTPSNPIEILPAQAAALPLAVEINKPVGRLAHLSAYTSRPQETDSEPCISASGMDICKLNLNLRSIPADSLCASNDYAFGTRLLVDKLGVCVVVDRMNKRYTGKGNVDWYFGMDTARAMKFGRQDLSIIKL